MAVTAWAVRCEATWFAVAATNQSALSSDETGSVEMRSDDVRWMI